MTVATRKIVLSGLLGIVSAGVIATTGYAAHEPRWVQEMSRPALHETLATAIVTNNYDAFENAIRGKPGALSITHEQFDALVGAYELYEQGSSDQAQQLLAHAGIKAPTTT
ncbi:MAG: hypothetical protein V4478_01025 [Patescibacteria group bacterium]